MLLWFSRFLTGLVGITLFLVLATQIISRTAFNGSFIEGQLTKIDGYNRLSNAISTQLTKDTYAANPMLPPSEQVLITPDALRFKLNAVLDQLQPYYQGKINAPTLDLRDLIGQSQAAGLPIPADSSLNKPISLGTPTGQTFVHKLHATQTGALITAVALTLLLVFVCWRLNRYIALPGALIWFGVLGMFTAAMLWFAPGALNHIIHFDTGINSFANIIRDLVSNIARDISKQYGLVAGIALVVGIAGYFGVKRWHSPKPAAKAPGK